MSNSSMEKTSAERCNSSYVNTSGAGWPFAHPPLRHSVQSFQVSSRRALHEAHNIQIGMVRLKFARNGGPVEHRRLQVVTRRRLQFLYDLFELRFHRTPSKLVPEKLADC